MNLKKWFFKVLKIFFLFKYFNQVSVEVNTTANVTPKSEKVTGLKLKVLSLIGFEKLLKPNFFVKFIK